MAAINSSLYEDIEISTETTTGEARTVDLKLGVIKLNYYEDLFSPTITAQVLVVSSGNATNESGDVIETVYSGLPIRGGERVKIRIKNNTEKNIPIEFDTPETYLYVSNVSREYANGAKEIFTLDLVSREAITNETSRVVGRYHKTAKISEHVKSIISEKLKSTIADSDVDETINPYGFIGNLKKPFQVLVWLASKGQPKNGLPGYFFYQTKDGFRFKSIDKLIEDGKKNPKAKYVETQYAESSKLTDVNDFDILQYNVRKNNDLIQKLTVGQYRSHFMEFDPLLGLFTTEQQGKMTLNDITNDTISLGETPEVPKLLNDEDLTLGSLPSRLVTMVSDRGLLEYDPSLEKNSKPFMWQRQAIMRYQLLFTQILNMVVPLNTTLVAGDVIEIKFLNAEMESKEHDRQQSGFYMIKELCHHFDANQSLTSLTLIRDTFGEISK